MKSTAPKSWKLAATVVALLAGGGTAAFYARRDTVPVSAPTTRYVANKQVLDTSSNSSLASTSASPVAKLSTYQFVASYPHDKSAFTQGLLWYNGGFYESTGLEGRSTLRRVEFPSGRVIQRRALSSNVFAEGLALANDTLVQLTWMNRRAIVYDRATLRPLREHTYEGEGWGLAFDGRHFVMSNGSDTLTFRDVKTFAVVRRLKVTFDDKPLDQLNELEVIEGEIWANVWRTDFIVRIDPSNGRVRSYLDLKGLLPRSDRSGTEDVLNGIAYDPQKKRVFVTGKNWPKLFEIKVP